MLRTRFLSRSLQAYQDKWTPQMDGKLKTTIEPDNIMIKYAVCVFTYNDIVGHLPKDKSGKFATKLFLS